MGNQKECLESLRSVPKSKIIDLSSLEHVLSSHLRQINGYCCDIEDASSINSPHLVSTAMHRLSIVLPYAWTIENDLDELIELIIDHFTSPQGRIVEIYDQIQSTLDDLGKTKNRVNQKTKRTKNLK